MKFFIESLLQIFAHAKTTILSGMRKILKQSNRKKWACKKCFSFDLIHKWGILSEIDFREAFKLRSFVDKSSFNFICFLVKINFMNIEMQLI